MTRAGAAVRGMATVSGPLDSGSGWATASGSGCGTGSGTGWPGRGTRASPRPGIGLGRHERALELAGRRNPTPGIPAWIWRPDSDSPAIFSWSRTIPWRSASGEADIRGRRRRPG